MVPREKGTMTPNLLGLVAGVLTVGVASGATLAFPGEDSVRHASADHKRPANLNTNVTHAHLLTDKTGRRETSLSEALEPTTLLLLGSALAGVGMAVKRRRAARPAD
jgi:hypothetical protein